MLASLAAAAAALLVVSGLAKIRSPRPAARMIATVLRVQRVPSSARRLVTRAVGTLEIAGGALAIALGGRVAFGAVSVGYLVLLVVSARLYALGRSGTRIPCGCFGRDDTPVGVAHLVLNVVGFGVALGATVNDVPAWAGLADVPDSSPARLLAGGAQIVLLTWLAYLSITALPALGAARRAVLSPPGSR